MQEIQSIDGGVGRLFLRDGGEGGGDSRLKPHQYHQGFAAGAGHGYQALKCPRCDSLNTKFCYYNNYNLSQPRYFCKGCRRYWTKGGVLRNVPVGGGCRKNKRSKQNSGNVDPPTSQRKSSESRNSSSESSSPPEKAKATTPAPVAPTKLLSFQESSTKLDTEPQSSTVFDKCVTDNRQHHMLSIETFKSLLTSSSDQVPLGFNFMEQQDGVEKQEESKLKQQWMDETTYLRTSNGGAAAEDWEGGCGGEDGLFDQSYWSQISWSNHDHQLNYFN